MAPLLAAEAEPMLASVGFGGYLVALVAWVFGLIMQTAAVPTAAAQRSESGETPSWMHPMWSAGSLAEGLWIIGANVAYVALALAILQSGLVGAWAGWIALGLGVLIPIFVGVTSSRIGPRRSSGEVHRSALGLGSIGTP